MKVLDEKFKHNKARYVLQCLLATLSVAVILLLLDTMSHAAIIAALGASSFIAFTMPEAPMSRPRFLIGGYLVGMVSGCLCHCLCAMSLLAQSSTTGPYLDVLFGAIAVGLAIFVMVITNTEHPPAASLALGLVLHDGCDYRTLTVVLIGIVSLSVVKAALKPVLRDLL